MLLLCVLTFLKNVFASRNFNRATILLPYRSYFHLKNLPYGTLGPEGLIEYDIAAVYDIIDKLIYILWLGSTKMIYLTFSWHFWEFTDFQIIYIRFIVLLFEAPIWNSNEFRCASFWTGLYTVQRQKSLDTFSFEPYDFFRRGGKPYWIGKRVL